MVGEVEVIYVEMLDGHGMEYSCISICRAFTCKGSRVTQRVVKLQVERIF